MNHKQEKKKLLITYFYKNIDKSIVGFYYEMILGILALIAFLNAFKSMESPNYLLEHPPAFWFNQFVLFLFTADYIFRLATADNKNVFFKKNILLFIAILPFTPLFRIARLLRLGVYFNQFHKRVSRFFISNALIYSLYSVFLLLITCSLLFYHYEKGITIKTFGDSIWWAIVTATTVGYGDYIPATGLGRIIASILMMAGVVFFGILTTTFTTYILTNKSEQDTKSNTVDFECMCLTQEERRKVNQYIEGLKIASERKNE